MPPVPPKRLHPSHRKLLLYELWKSYQVSNIGKKPFNLSKDSNDLKPELARSRFNQTYSGARDANEPSTHYEYYGKKVKVIERVHPIIHHHKHRKGSHSKGDFVQRRVRLHPNNSPHSFNQTNGLN